MLTNARWTAALLCTALTIVVGCAKEKDEEGAATGATGAVSTVEAPASVTYVCPMHPEVVSDKPGKCPKCGMDLVENRTVSSAADESPKEWSCPRHPGTLYGPGERCEICGLELVRITDGAPPTAAPATLDKPAPDASAPPPAEVATLDALPIGNAKDAEGHYLCPVMGGVIKDTSAAESVEYDGKVYYFCCAGCPDQFNADPASFVAKLGP